MSPNTEAIPFARPTLGSEEEKAVLSVLRSGWLTTGRICRTFEEEFAAYLGTDHALAVNSATAGLHLSLEALNLEPGSFVATTPYTFTASAEIIRYVGCDPLFIDIEADSYNIDAYLLKKALTREGRHVSAVLPVHVAGLPCSMDPILKLAEQHEIPVVEDAAHAFPVRRPGGFVGSQGDAGVYSFYANKTITTGEGGMVVTDRGELADRIRIMRYHGIDRESWDRYTSPNGNWEYRVVDAGYKYNMTDLCAAIGREQLKKAELFLGKRREIARRYISELAECEFLTLPAYSDKHAWHLFLIRLKEGRLRIGRDRFIQKLKERGIGTSVHYIPLHVMPYYKNRYGFKDKDFPVSYANFKSTISLPIYPSLTGEQVSRIVAEIKRIGYNACSTYAR
jgi:dTDP-4-amino-4,6-dideoxygalactose transaminase